MCAGGEVLGVYHKRLLPNYAVFDEQRYFTAGQEPLELYVVGGVRVGVSICEDAWSPNGPIAAQAAGGAELVVNINASPYFAGRLAQRERMLATRAADASCALVYVNQVGRSGRAGLRRRLAGGRRRRRARRPRRAVRAKPCWSSTSTCARCSASACSIRVAGSAPSPSARSSSREQPRRGRPHRGADDHPRARPVAEVYEALVLGTRDYTRKNGFTRRGARAVRGASTRRSSPASPPTPSGREHVHSVAMPSRYSSEGSRTDAEALAEHLGIDHRLIAIEEAFAAFLDLLAPSFAGRTPDLTEENLQSRIRGMLLMALSNKFGWLVLTTGNKSEMAVGYSTLYGDSAGGFAVIKDVPKLLVYQLVPHVNERAGREIIPEAVFTKPPSAELRPDQRDDQSLPPYEVLDPILEAYVEHDRTAAELIGDGFDEATVRRITRLVDLAEYKRRQSPPGVRVTPKAFGKDRRLPITNRYRAG